MNKKIINLELAWTGFVSSGNSYTTYAVKVPKGLKENINSHVRYSGYIDTYNNHVFIITLC